MDGETALPAQVVALFRELEDVLAGARVRLDALVRDAVPVQQPSAALAAPDTCSR